MHKTPEITKLIHENFWLVLLFALSRPAVKEMLEHFEGEWEPLRDSFGERAEIRADRALLEMSTQLRVLDDADGISDRFKEPFGTLIKKNGATTALSLREVTNKVIHASSFQWDFSDVKKPKVICLPGDSDSWVLAEVDLIALAGAIGCLSF